ncbi:MAG: hypothetical protein Q4A74_01600 [Cardiobacteriaceae bacterium]|nr:hypothetical protein [Cardiobacteriaceae bacterium]
MAGWYEGSIDTDRYGNVINGGNKYKDLYHHYGGGEYISSPWGVPWFQPPINDKGMTNEQRIAAGRKQTLNILNEINNRVAQRQVDSVNKEAAEKRQESIRKSDEIRALYNAKIKHLEALAQQQQEATNNINAHFKSSTAAARNPQRGAYEAEQQLKQGSGTNNATGGTLLTNSGELDGGQKLGKKGQLGGCTMLGI